MDALFDELYNTYVNICSNSYTVAIKIVSPFLISLNSSTLALEYNVEPEATAKLS